MPVQMAEALRLGLRGKNDAIVAWANKSFDGRITAPGISLVQTESVR
jgi:hypothetical protein